LKQTLLSRGFHGLKLFRGASMFRKNRWKMAVTFESAKLLTTAFKTLQWYKNKKKVLHQLQNKMDNAYEYFAKKRGFKLFVRKSRELMQRNRLYELALKFYQEKLARKYY
jgi:hypothetical protein